MLRLNLVTPTKKLLTDLPIEEVFVPAFRGELNILTGHAALMTTLTTGVLRFRRSAESELEPVAISWGYLEVANDRVTVLAETAETAKEIDIERAREALKASEKALGSTDLNPEDVSRHQAKLQRAIIRLEISGGVNPEGRGGHA